MDLGKHLENASEAVKRRNFPLAVKIYSQVLQIQPDYGEARAGLRKALFTKAAMKPTSKLTAVVGGGMHRVFGALCRLLGRHAAAARACERYLVYDPLNEAANLQLGHTLCRAGFKKSALAVFQALAEAQPRCLDACRSAGGLLYEQGQVQQAMAMYEQALKIDPRDQESLKARKDLAAEGALRSSGIDKAQSSRELVKDKDKQRELERQDRIQLSAEEIGTELEQLEAKLQQNPDDPKVLRRVGKLREQRKDLQGALDCLERALQLAPQDGELLDSVGDLRLRLQEQAVQEAAARGDEAAAGRARRALQEARVAESRRRVERNPADLGLRFLLGSALLDLGDTDSAIAELQQAVKDPRKKVESLFLLGRAFQRKALPELAMGQFEKALQAAGSGQLAKEALYELGVVCEGLGKREQALQHFTRVLEQDIGFRDVAKKVERLKQAAT
jgi:tetratricopeptide (TPR) repeat protein